MINTIIGNDWDSLLQEEFQADYFKQLMRFLESEYETQTIYPSQDKIFEAFRLTPYSAVKVVILGQDPYHEAGQAHGLAFSVPAGIKYPPSLRNILRECEDDMGKVNVAAAASSSAALPHASDYVSAGVLDSWAKQGVLLLNSVLSVRDHEPGSHANRGWERFTDRVIELLAERDVPLVFILWGAYAAKKQTIIDVVSDRRIDARHLVITAPHPSPLSAHRGFFGGHYFSRANEFLGKNGLKEIEW